MHLDVGKRFIRSEFCPCKLLAPSHPRLLRLRDPARRGRSAHRHLIQALGQLAQRRHVRRPRRLAVLDRRQHVPGVRSRGLDGSQPDIGSGQCAAGRGDGVRVAPDLDAGEDRLPEVIRRAQECLRPGLQQTRSSVRARQRAASIRGRGAHVDRKARRVHRKHRDLSFMKHPWPTTTSDAFGRTLFSAS